MNLYKVDMDGYDISNIECIGDGIITTHGIPIRYLEEHLIQLGYVLLSGYYIIDLNFNFEQTLEYTKYKDLLMIKLREDKFLSLLE